MDALSIPQAAQKLDESRWTTWRRVRRGELAAFRLLDHGDWVVPREALLALLALQNDDGAEATAPTAYNATTAGRVGGHDAARRA